MRFINLNYKANPLFKSFKMLFQLALLSKEIRRTNPPASTKSAPCLKKIRHKYTLLLNDDGTPDDKRTLDGI